MGFADEAALTQQCNNDLDSNNTIKFAVHSAQVEAYSPMEDRVYLNEQENLFAVFDGHGGDILTLNHYFPLIIHFVY